MPGHQKRVGAAKRAGWEFRVHHSQPAFAINLAEFPPTRVTPSNRYQDVFFGFLFVYLDSLVMGIMRAITIGGDERRTCQRQPGVAMQPRAAQSAPGIRKQQGPSSTSSPKPESGSNQGLARSIPEAGWTARQVPHPSKFQKVDV